MRASQVAQASVAAKYCASASTLFIFQLVPIQTGCLSDIAEILREMQSDTLLPQRFQPASGQRPRRDDPVEDAEVGEMMQRRPSELLVVGHQVAPGRGGDHP